ncbi:MAG: YwgA family protein [Bacillaceae bacterium]|nr:YwgA family protein [Bacillaceae bacterium]
MLEGHAKLLSILNQAGEIVGRKKLQKMVYIAKKLNFPFNERYNFHFYGPYSEELTLKIEEMCNLGFINEVKENKGGYFQYRYKLSETGKEFLDLSKIEEMEHLEAFTLSINQQSSRFLELVSTVVYFDNCTKEEVMEKVNTLKKKQNYSNEEIEDAFQYLENLKLLVNKKGASMC